MYQPIDWMAATRGAAKGLAFWIEVVTDAGLNPRVVGMAWTERQADMVFSLMELHTIDDRRGIDSRQVPDGLWELVK